MIAAPLAPPLGLCPAQRIKIPMIAGGNHTTIYAGANRLRGCPKAPLCKGGAPRSESKSSMIAGGNHTTVYAVAKRLRGCQSLRPPATSLYTREAKSLPPPCGHLPQGGRQDTVHRRKHHIADESRYAHFLKSPILYHGESAKSSQPGKDFSPGAADCDSILYPEGASIERKAHWNGWKGWL